MRLLIAVNILFLQIAIASSLLLDPVMKICPTVRRVPLVVKLTSASQQLRNSRHLCSGRGCLAALDLSNDNNDEGGSLQTQSSWQNPKSPLVNALLQKATSRALRTLSTSAPGNWDDATVEEPANDSIQNTIDVAVARSSKTLDNLRPEDEEPNSTNQAKQPQDKRSYLNNPCVTPTALAHALWRSVIIPYHDTVIDATCGNGKDCLALAKMLFPDGHTYSDVHPHLIGIDIQARAIANTRRSLLSALPDDIYYKHVTLLEQSHEHLLDVIKPRDDGKQQQVGLVCYNLGYLPGGQADNGNYKDVKTQTETTLNSITDAALLLRAGGLLSIMVYPGSNLEESLAVEHFVEGLAMLTTRDEGGWREYLKNIPDYSIDADGPSNGSSIRDIVSNAIERVAVDGSQKQTWRVFVHKPLGRPLSPVLCTAHRIK